MLENNANTRSRIPVLRAQVLIIPVFERQRLMSQGCPHNSGPPFEVDFHLKMPMDLDSGATRSLWIDGVELPPTTALTSSIAADVCIVGAGIAGLTTAYLLSREGAMVVVIDDGPLC